MLKEGRGDHALRFFFFAKPKTDEKQLLLLVFPNQLLLQGVFRTPTNIRYI